MRIVSKAHSKELHTAQQKPGRLGGAGRDNDVAAPEDGTGCNPAICLTSFFKEAQSRMKNVEKQTDWYLMFPRALKGKRMSKSQAAGPSES